MSPIVTKKVFYLFITLCLCLDVFLPAMEFCPFLVRIGRQRESRLRKGGEENDKKCTS